MEKRKKGLSDRLKREELEFIDRLCDECLFTTGHKLSRIEVISALVDAAAMLGISAKGANNGKELTQKILDTVYSGPDRREYPRLKKNLAVGLRKLDSSEKYARSITSNAGIGGFRVEVAFLGKPLAINQIIEITINEPEEKSTPIKAIGRVAWVREKEDRHSHELGVAIPFMKRSDEEQFLKFITKEIDRASVSEE